MAKRKKGQKDKQLEVKTNLTSCESIPARNSERRKLKIEQHEPQEKPGVNPGGPER